MIKPEPMVMPSGTCSLFELSYSYGRRIRIVDAPPVPRAPHTFIKGTGSIRKFGATMRNPPSPIDFMPNPFCRVCRRFAKDEIHDVTSNHDPGDEDRR